MARRRKEIERGKKIVKKEGETRKQKTTKRRMGKNQRNSVKRKKRRVG